MRHATTSPPAWLEAIELSGFGEDTFQTNLACFRPFVNSKNCRIQMLGIIYLVRVSCCKLGVGGSNHLLQLCALLSREQN